MFNEFKELDGELDEGLLKDNNSSQSPILNDEESIEAIFARKVESCSLEELRKKSADELFEEACQESERKGSDASDFEHKL